MQRIVWAAVVLWACVDPVLAADEQRREREFRLALEVPMRQQVPIEQLVKHEQAAQAIYAGGGRIFPTVDPVTNKQGMGVEIPRTWKVQELPPLHDVWRLRYLRVDGFIDVKPKLDELGRTQFDVTGKLLIEIIAKPGFTEKTVKDALAQLSSLRQLELHGRLFTDTVLKPVGSMHDLWELKLHTCAMNGEGLRHLRDCSHIECLYINDCGQEVHLDSVFKSDSLAYLADLPELRVLSLMGTRIRDEGCQVLAEIPFVNIAVLDLTSTAITEKGLREVGAIKSLKRLSVNNGKGPLLDAARKLQQEQPEIEVEF